MTDDILDQLEALGYAGPLLDKTSLASAIDEGLNSLQYTELVSWLANELHSICKLEENVNSIKNVNDSNSFLMELSSFLRELGCPHLCLTQGDMNGRLGSTKNRILLLDYLCSELQAARMIYSAHGDGSSMKFEMNESSTARDLKNMLMTLSFPKPPENITTNQLFEKVEKKLRELISIHSASIVSKPLFTGVLTQKQWSELGDVQKQMHEDYTIRREVLLTRLDITVQSFKWGDAGKRRLDEIEKTYKKLRQNLSKTPDAHLAGILSAREDLTIEEKTSSANVRKNTHCNIQKLIIGAVPDRGGRPEDQMPPPPEMPSWQKRTEPPPQSGRGGRGGGYQGNYNQGGNYGNQGSYDDPNDRGGGGYQQRGRGGSRGRGGRGGQSQSGGQGYFNQQTVYDAAGAYGGFQPHQQNFQRTN